MSRPVLLLGGAGGATAQSVLTAARSLGVPVHLATDRAGAGRRQDARARYAGVVVADLRRPEQAVGRLAEYCLRQGVGGVAADREPLAPLAASVADVLGLPGHPPGAAAVVRDRRRTAQILLAHGVPGPRTLAVRFSGTAETRRRAAGLAYPVVVRPAESPGASGAAVVRNARELPEAVERVLERRGDPARGTAPVPVALVQEYLEGTEYRVESVLRAGRFGHLAMLRATDEDGPVRRVAGYTLPSGLPDATAFAILSVVERGLTALGLRDGLAHTALKLTADGPRLLTVGTAAPEAPVTELIEHATGVSAAGVYLQSVLGERPEISPHGLRPAALRYITTARHGVFHGLRGLLASPYAAAVRSYVDLGAGVGGGQEGPAGGVRTRLGHVIATADGPDRADARADEALAGITVQVGV
ncbi:ATP-grasp domain-containing protein [Streptomyces sp. NPDC007945]|uniref:ATP-grasp domain-containing protein n=1 Tax=Streptomyces sp. NPDC007945 TaxID=3364797 RepID=UPI0036F0E8B7